MDIRTMALLLDSKTQPAKTMILLSVQVCWQPFGFWQQQLKALRNFQVKDVNLL